MQSQLHEQLTPLDREVKQTRVLRDVYMAAEKIMQICDLRLRSSGIDSQNIPLKSIK